MNFGHRVISFDGSAQMARLVSQHCRQPVLIMAFKDLKDLKDLKASSEFDGIWACGSLVHLGEDELLTSLGSLARALKPSGTFFFCLKKGARDQSKVDSVTGRFFNRHYIGSIAPWLRALVLESSENNAKSYALAILDVVKFRHRNVNLDDLEVVLVWRSLGMATACWLAANAKVDRLVLMSPSASISSVM